MEGTIASPTSTQTTAAGDPSDFGGDDSHNPDGKNIDILDAGPRCPFLCWRIYLRALVPGLVTGASDDDPSGIAIYAQTEAQFGFGML